MTINTFPTYKEAESAQYHVNFSNHAVGESYGIARMRIEDRPCSLLNGGMRGIPGRSAAKTKIQKVNFIMEYDLGYYRDSDGIICHKDNDYYEYKAAPEAAPAPEVTPDRPRSQKVWADLKVTRPATIVLVNNEDHPTSLLTYGDDATKVSDAFATELGRKLATHKARLDGAYITRAIISEDLLPLVLDALEAAGIAVTYPSQIPNIGNR